MACMKIAVHELKRHYSTGNKSFFHFQIRVLRNPSVPCQQKKNKNYTDDEVFKWVLLLFFSGHHAK
jgi:hypothetical protein